MKSRIKSMLSFVLVVILSVTAFSLSVFAAPSFNQLVNAATEIIMSNEGEYTTVVRNDVGALSIGKICWHATNALNLLKEIVALNPSQAVTILGSTLYNEIVTSTYWETKIPTKEEANAISVLLATSESRYVQDKTAAKYIGEYIEHGQKLGITEPEALIFFADFENQNGKTGAANYYYEVKTKYGKVNLATLYECSSKNYRRTKTYNFCATLDWDKYEDDMSYEQDKTAPELTNVVVSNLTSSGYTVSCSASDNEAVSVIYFVVYRKDDGIKAAKWHSVEGLSSAAYTVDISNFGGAAGDYCTYIYAFDAAGNYVSAQLNTITVPEKEPATLPLTVTVTASGAQKVGDEIRWRAVSANGSGNYQYEFVLYRDKVIIDKRKYNDFSDYAYTVDKTGSYHVVVNVKDITNGTSASVVSTDINIFTPITVNSLESDTTYATAGQTAVWTAVASGGEGTLRYSYTVYKNDTSIYSSAFSTDSRFLYKFTSDGLYCVTVTVMDSRSQVVTFRSGSVIVTRPLGVENIAFSKSYAVVGQTVVCDADIVGGGGSYTCVFSIYCDSEPVIVSEETDSGEYAFVVTKAGKYTAKVAVTDSDGTLIEVSGGSMKADEQPVTGDANCDGKVSASDARFALRCAAKLETYDDALLYALDVDSDGKISAGDARRILRVAAQLEKF